jgi:hypothetical protein
MAPSFPAVEDEGDIMPLQLFIGDKLTNEFFPFPLEVTVLNTDEVIAVYYD